MPATAPPEPATFTQTTPSSAVTTASRQPYGELDEDLLEYPSTFTSPGPSEVEFTPLALSNQAHTIAEQREQPKFNFSLRRLSTPSLTSPLYKPIDASHSSLLSFPKLGLWSKRRKALQRCGTVTGNVYYNEHSRLTSPSTVSASMLEEPVPLAPLNYGSNASCKQGTSLKPCLHFTMAFSPEQQTLSVSVLSLSRTNHTLADVSVLGSLPPLYPCPIPATVQSSISHEPQSLVFLLQVSSVSELQRCTLRIAVYTQEPCGMRSTALGELEADCGGRDWTAEQLFHISQELNPNTCTLEKVEVFCIQVSCHRRTLYFRYIYLSLNEHRSYIKAQIIQIKL